MVDAPTFKELREARNLTQAELAALSLLTPTHVHRLETGKATRPGAGTVRRLAATLGVSAQELRAALERREGQGHDGR